MAIEFKFLEAGSGDAILISVDGKNILVDGGEKHQFISSQLEALRESEQLLDLVVLTHIDDDHIQGILELLGKPEDRKMVQRIWFNPFDEVRFESSAKTSETSFKQGIEFAQLVKELKQENDSFSYDDALFTEAKPSEIGLFDNVTIDLLSPNEEKLRKLHETYEKYIAKHKPDKTTSRTERTTKGSTIEELANYRFTGDTSPCNGASIAFILTYKKKDRFLLLADAHIDVVTDSLKRKGFSTENKLKVNFVKLSHHGSKNNVNQDFLNLIESDTFVISTDGIRHNHPDIETLCRIIANPERDKSKHLKFVFNYEDVHERFFSKEPQFQQESRKQYNFSLEYLDQGDGLKF